MTSYYSDRQVVARYVADGTDLTPVEARLFAAHLGDRMDVLDLGIGAGRTTPHLRGLGGRYVGIDVEPAMVAACRERFPDADVRVGDAADLSAFDDGSFDAVVFSFNGLDYVARRAACLDECRRVLRPGGVLLLSRHNPRSVLAVPRRLKAPLWVLRRAVRLVPTRAFWSGSGTVVEPPAGFNGPLLRRAAGTPLLTATATPRRVHRELRDHGFDIVTTAGGSAPTTSSYHYVARRGGQRWGVSLGPRMGSRVQSQAGSSERTGGWSMNSARQRTSLRRRPRPTAGDHEPVVAACCSSGARSRTDTMPFTATAATSTHR
jgi:SAM-dependent methyltransferase